MILPGSINKQPQYFCFSTTVYERQGFEKMTSFEFRRPEFSPSVVFSNALLKKKKKKVSLRIKLARKRLLTHIVIKNFK